MEMRSKVKKMQKDLESQTSDYENAGVKVTVRGDLTVSAIKIDPEVVDITRLDKLERTILENTNKALKKTGNGTRRPHGRSLSPHSANWL